MPPIKLFCPKLKGKIIALSKFEHRYRLLAKIMQVAKNLDPRGKGFHGGSNVFHQTLTFVSLIFFWGGAVVECKTRSITVAE